MRELRFTVVGEGLSDRALLYVLRWVLSRHLPGTAIQGGWPDFGRLPRRPVHLAERIRKGVELEPCDLLFVHRDADRESREARVGEIWHAMAEIQASAEGATVPPTIPVVPVRMLETWLLTDETALRHAAGNPNCSVPLSLPRVRDLEGLPNPKDILLDILRTASGHGAHRRARIRANPIRVAELTNDFSTLRNLSAFRAFEADVVRLIAEQRWPEGP